MTADGGATWADILDPSMDNDIQSFSKTGMVFLDSQTGWLTRDHRASIRPRTSFAPRTLG